MERGKIFMSAITGTIRMEALEEGANMTITIVIIHLIMTGYTVHLSLFID